MTARTLRLVRAAAPALLIGCISAGLPRATPPDLYALDPQLPRARATDEEAATPLAVAAPRAVPGLETRGMVYVQREHEIRYFARSAWVEPPARMLAPLLAGALEASGAFRVTRDAAEPPARLRLETDLLRLQQEFTQRPSQVRVLLRVRLVDAAARRVLGDRSVEVVERAPSDDPYGGVVAANAAAARAVAEVADLCTRWARRDDGAAGAARAR